jgi:hypothetical protein
MRRERERERVAGAHDRGGEAPRLLTIAERLVANALLGTVDPVIVVLVLWDVTTHLRICTEGVRTAEARITSSDAR